VSRSPGWRGRDRIGEAERGAVRLLERARALPFGGGWLTGEGIRAQVYPKWAVAEALRNLEKAGTVESRTVGGQSHWRIRAHEPR